LARPHRACLIGCVVADCEYEIGRGSIRSLELRPGFGAQIARFVIELAQKFQREGIFPLGWLPAL